MSSKSPEPSDLARLQALRDRLRGVVDDPATSPRDLATVAREYRIVVEKIAAMTPSKGGSKLDEIAAKRAKRKGA